MTNYTNLQESVIFIVMQHGFFIGSFAILKSSNFFILHQGCFPRSKVFIYQW